MDLLSKISHQIHNSDIHWSDIGSWIGIDRYSILNIKQKPDPIVEFVNAVTQKIWKDIFHYVGMEFLNNNEYTEITSLLKLDDILAGCVHYKNNKDKTDCNVINEIAKRVSQWKAFGRILGLNESFLNQLERDFQSCYERNHEIIKKRCSPLEPDQSWLLWRPYLEQFDDGVNVITEMETIYVELLAQTPYESEHIICKENRYYIGHSYGHEYGYSKSISVKKENSIISVRIGSGDFTYPDYQTFSEWVKSQQRYTDIYDMLKHQKGINFEDGGERFCPILETIKHYIEQTNDPGFVVKGYNYVNHYCLFRTGIFAKDFSPDTYFCFLANDNVVIYITRSSAGASHALHESIRNVQIANVLHEDLQSSNIIQMNVIVYDESENPNTCFCKQCIEKQLYITEETFTDAETFVKWYNKILISYTTSYNVQNKIKKHGPKSKTVVEISNSIKKDMITYEALESCIFPSFSFCYDDQMEELKKLILLSPSQFNVLHSNRKHIVLRGSYGCGKSLILFKKLEQIISRKNQSDLIYFICNDQQSKLIHYMKAFVSKYPGNNILVCNSTDIIPEKTIPTLSLILEHIKNAWGNKIIHVLIDEFNGSYIDEREVEKLTKMLNHFSQSFIIIALQSMEEKIIDDNRKSMSQKLGYNYNVLIKETSFVCYNLDYSLRCSYEINEFVKCTARIFESDEVTHYSTDHFNPIHRLIVDNEQARELSKEESGRAMKVKYIYNQTDVHGHKVLCGPVNIYVVKKNKFISQIKEQVVFLFVLKFILHDISSKKKYVICTYNRELYNSTYHFLRRNSYRWTDKIEEFIKQDSTFDVLLMEYSGVRGYEFQNFIFLLPLNQKFLKYRMIECITRATTELHVIVDFCQGKVDISNTQLLSKWRQYDFVKLYNAKYNRLTDTFHLINSKIKIFSEKHPFEDSYSFVGNRYPWVYQSVELKEDEKYPVKVDEKTKTLSNIIDTDDVILLDEFCTYHEIDLHYHYDKHKNNLLFMAINVNAVKIAQFLIERYNFNINEKRYDNKTAIHLAADLGHIDLIRLLVEKGADVNSKGKYDYTPLHFAAEYGKENVVTYLIEHGADIFMVDDNGNTPLHLAALRGKIDTVKLLVEKGADIKLRNSSGRTPIICAAAYGFVELIKWFIQNGGVIEAYDYVSDIFVDLATRLGYRDVEHFKNYLEDKGGN